MPQFTYMDGQFLLSAGVVSNHQPPNAWGFFGMCSNDGEWVYDEWFDVDAPRDVARNYDPRAVKEQWVDHPSVEGVNSSEGRRTRDFYRDALGTRAAEGSGALPWERIVTGLRVARTLVAK